MVQLHVGPHAAVLPFQEVLGAPDAHCAVVSAGCQVLPIAAEVQAGDASTVALQNTRKLVLAS